MASPRLVGAALSLPLVLIGEGDGVTFDSDREVNSVPFRMAASKAPRPPPSIGFAIGAFRDVGLDLETTDALDDGLDRGATDALDDGLDRGVTDALDDGLDRETWGVFEGASVVDACETGRDFGRRCSISSSSCRGA